MANKKRKIKAYKLYIRRSRAFLKEVRRTGHGTRRYSKNFIFKQLLKNSLIFKTFDEKKFYRKPVIINEITYIDIPEIFSFSKNPSETINVFKEITYSIKNEYSIFINHEKCKEIDLAASLVMDVILIEYKNLCKKSKSKINVSGKLAKNQKVNELLEFSGILNSLGISKKRDNSRLVLLPLTKNEDAGIMTTKIIDYFNNCLMRRNFILNEVGELNFSTMIGEVVSNCSDHGGDKVQWYALGHYTEYDSECNLTIFDFGNTIYESLKDNSISINTVNKLQELTNYHKKAFKKTDEELLWTLFSLQHGISRLNSEQDNTRGLGTIDLIDSFQNLGMKYDENNNLLKPIMSITSGKINILFDGTYTIKEDVNGLKNIAFNEANDLKEQPDEKYVKNINNFFPGTVISIKIFIDRKYIEEIRQDE